ERRAASFAVARRGDAAAVELDDVLHDGQAESEAAVRARRAAVALTEALEDQRKELAADALAGVGDGDAHGVALRLIGANGDRAARRRELHRVGKKVPDYLLQALGVAGGDAVDAREVEVQRDPFRGDARPHRVDGGLDDALQVHRRDVELQLPGDDARDV